MSNGTLARVNVTSTDYTLVYNCPGSVISTTTINVCNRNPNSVSVRLSISDTLIPNDSDFIEFNVTIPAYGILERTGVVLDNNKKILIKSSSPNLSVVVYGFEDTQ